MVEGWQNRCGDTRIAVDVKEEFFMIFLCIVNLGPSLFERGIGHEDRPSIQNSAPLPQY
jgi:hypothetical protein